MDPGEPIVLKPPKNVANYILLSFLFFSIAVIVITLGLAPIYLKYFSPSGNSTKGILSSPSYSTTTLTTNSQSTESTSTLLTTATTTTSTTTSTSISTTSTTTTTTTTLSTKPVFTKCGSPLIHPSYSRSSLANNNFERITRGKDAIPNSWPFMVSLRYYDGSNILEHFCGGTLISTWFVLTAAQCVFGLELADMVVIVGVNYLNESITQENIFYPQSYVYHPSFNRTSLESGNDIALIKLSQTVKLSSTVSIICMPATINDFDNLIDKFGVALGWGSRGAQNDLAISLQQAKLDVVNSSLCSDYEYSSNSTYCAFDVFFLNSICYGDEGGPLLFNLNDQWYLYGIASFFNLNSESLCDPLQPQFFTSVPYYLNWINYNKFALENNITTQAVTTTTQTVITTTPSFLNCGIPSVNSTFSRANLQSRIYKGQDAIKNSWPWMISLRRFDGTNVLNHFCGGALISESEILTSAKCVFSLKPSALVAIVGAHYLNQTLTQENIYFVLSIYSHPLFNSSNLTLGNDIALITLTQAVNLSPLVTTICLPSSPDNFYDVYGKVVVTTGWGSFNLNETVSNTLQQTTLKIFNNDPTSLCSLYSFDENSYCAIDSIKIRSSNICFYDQGGPLIFYFEGQWYLYGVASYFVSNEFNRCNTSQPSFFTGVSDYLDWIDDPVSFQTTISSKASTIFVSSTSTSFSTQTSNSTITSLNSDSTATYSSLSSQSSSSSSSTDSELSSKSSSTASPSNSSQSSQSTTSPTSSSSQSTSSINVTDSLSADGFSTSPTASSSYFTDTTSVSSTKV